MLNSQAQLMAAFEASVLHSPALPAARVERACPQPAGSAAAGCSHLQV